MGTHRSSSRWSTRPPGDHHFQAQAHGPQVPGHGPLLLVLENNVVPVKVDNFYVCDRETNTSEKYVRVSDMCALLAEVDDRTGNPNKHNLLPIAHAFPISWIA